MAGWRSEVVPLLLLRGAAGTEQALLRRALRACVPGYTRAAPRHCATEILPRALDTSLKPARRMKVTSRHARLRNSVKRRKQALVERRALPTPERLRRAGADVERGDSGQLTMRDSPLERALARNALTTEQYSAGQKYRHHWYHAGLASQLGSLDLNRVLAVDIGGYAGMPKTENQLFHRQRYRETAQAAGKIGSYVLEWAVCREVALDQVGLALGWSSRAQAYAAALERMKAALDELCKLWGIGNG